MRQPLPQQSESEERWTVMVRDFEDGHRTLVIVGGHISDERRDGEMFAVVPAIPLTGKETPHG